MCQMDWTSSQIIDDDNDNEDDKEKEENFIVEWFLARGFEYDSPTPNLKDFVACKQQ